jgi:hypothetical protein
MEAVKVQVEQPRLVALCWLSYERIVWLGFRADQVPAGQVRFLAFAIVDDAGRVEKPHELVQ